MKWYVRWRWGLVPAVFGVVILLFVIVTGFSHVWTLWIAVPLLMIGLGYLFVVNAIESLWAIERRVQQDREDKK